MRQLDRLLRVAACLLLAQTLAGADDQKAESPFIARPYLQLGHEQIPGSLLVVWHGPDRDMDWKLEFRSAADESWKAGSVIESSVVKVDTVEPHRVISSRLSGLEPGKPFAYRVLLNKEVVFTAEAIGPKSKDQAQRFVVLGDCGAGTAEQKALAVQVYQTKPDFLFVTGDIVYSRGRVSEYREKFWPIYNADQPLKTQGAPLLRSSLFLAAPGNHDIATRDLDKYPDALAYYYYWKQPLNGPAGDQTKAKVPKLVGTDEHQKAFLAGTDRSFPVMNSFSFDHGGAHWIVLDSNSYVDWSKDEVRSWIRQDLAKAKDATWRFVGFHHPGFNSSKSHFNEQQTRLLAPLFEEGKVDVVFTGHVHNYQRTFPLTFKPEGLKKQIVDKQGKTIDVNHVDGVWKLDRTYDGKTDTTPEGVIYLVTGAGGQKLYNPEQQDDPASWQEFTTRFISKVHSFTQAEIDGKTLTIRQLGTDGKELDRFVLTK